MVFYLCIFITMKNTLQTLNTLFKVENAKIYGYLIVICLTNFHNLSVSSRNKMSLYGLKETLSSFYVVHAYSLLPGITFISSVHCSKLKIHKLKAVWWWYFWRIFTIWLVIPRQNLVSMEPRWQNCLVFLFFPIILMRSNSQTLNTLFKVRNLYIYGTWLW